MSKYITVIVTDRQGNPEYYAEVTAYKDGFFTGGRLNQEHTDRDGKVTFDLDVSDSTKIAFSARVSGRKADSSFDYPYTPVYLRVE